MPEFLTTHKTASSIEDIIIKAKNKLVLVSPYLQLSDALFIRLKDANTRSVKIILIYGKSKLKPEEINLLKKLSNLSLYFCKELHAKCYYNEDNMVITSMNMYEFSEKNNREMGVLINRQDDSGVFNDASEEVESILRSSSQEYVGRSNFKTRSNVASKHIKKLSGTPPGRKEGFSLGGMVSAVGSFLAGDGYCIRCGTRIPSNIQRPFCDECYSKWASFKNNNFREHYCHSCGKKSKTTTIKPRCWACYSD